MTRNKVLIISYIIMFLLRYMVGLRFCTWLCYVLKLCFSDWCSSAQCDRICHAFVTPVCWILHKAKIIRTCFQTMNEQWYYFCRVWTLSLMYCYSSVQKKCCFKVLVIFRLLFLSTHFGGFICLATQFFLSSLPVSSSVFILIVRANNNA